MPAHTHILTEEGLFCLEGCRSYKQYFKMRKGFEEGACAFCNLDRNHNRVEWEDEYAFAWLVPANYSREELWYHALFVPKRHVRMEIELTDKEVLSLHRAKKVLHTKYGYRGGNTHVREGDMRLNAGTVPHLHYNTFQPDPKAIARLVKEERLKAQSECRIPKKIEVRIPVFKDPSDRKVNQERAAAFAVRYEAGEIPAE